MSTPAIELSNLTKSYGRVQALKGLSLTVQSGEIFGFLGPNGSGKTTTIRCLLDLIRPSGGTVRVLGIDPQKEPVKVRAQVGYLPGELYLDGNSTAEAILRYFNRLRGGRADWGFVRQLAERLDLNLKRPIKQYSKGNKQKVGVVQALMHRPALLLLDEPTSGLDPLVQQEVLRLIREAQHDGATVFFSSHILSEVQEVAHQVGIIRQGELVEVADTETLMQRAVRRAIVRFAAPVAADAFTAIPGVEVLSSDGDTLHLQVSGEMDSFIKALAAYNVVELETQRPSLEEIFLAYYQQPQRAGVVQS